MKIEKLLLDKRALVALTAVAAILLSLAAYELRMIPYGNYLHVETLAVKYGIRKDIARYSLLNANDPWIEYWLADYLHKHGIGSWSTLTRDNPATHIFWYPWGRDFTETEYPLVPMLGSLGSDPLVSTVKLPAIAGAAMVLAAYVFGLVLYGPLTGILSAILAAFLPAAASRTFAGFVEKTGIAMPFMILSLMFYMLAISEESKRRSLSYALATSIFWLLLSLSWGGYALMNIAIALTVLLSPLSIGLRSPRYRSLLDVSLLAFLATSIVSMALSAAGYGKVSLSFIALTSIVLAFGYIVYLWANNRLPIAIPAKYAARPERLYLYILAFIVIAGPLIGYFAGIIKGKYAYTVFWPLRDAGLLHLGPLGETVAEMSGVLSRGNLRDFINETNVVGILAPFAGLYLLYRALRRREVVHIPLAALSLLLFYSVLGMLYLLQAFSSITLLAVAALVDLVAEGFWRTEKPAKKRRRTHHAGAGLEDLSRLAAIALLAIVLIGAAYAAADTARNFSQLAATVTGGTVNRIYLSWLWLLQHLSTATPKDTVVAAWWDYGYWISVGSERPTLADGATFNGTQIKLLATAFTGTEEEANTIFRELHLKPGHTLVLFNDYIVYNPKTGEIVYLFPESGIDLLKSWAMHHIAGRDKRFNTFLSTVAGLLQGNARQGAIKMIEGYVNTTLIYKLMIDAGYYAQTNGVIVPREFKSLLREIKVNNVRIAGAKIPLLKLRHFKPYMVVIAPFMDSQGRPIVNPDGSIVAHIIAVYTWEG